MPLVKKIKIEDGVIGIWEITESPNDFANLNLCVEDQLKLNKYSFDKRKVEFLAVRALLKELTNKGLIIDYQPDGRPHFNNRELEISISHSKNLVAIILNQNPVGIDVEVEGRQVHKIAKKFLSDKELDSIEKSKDKERSLLLYWCAKEAMFKITPQQGIDFKSQMEIKPFEISETGVFEAKLLTTSINLDLKLHYLFLKNNAVVWCIS